ncbi:hypothetical protein AGABI2DRAFT_180503 [Agaricus bisporus var. bisporus H97]|uniref:hypothetical protein n=1 Tax=Agaricus bisporus var. bisporus (strain H97 / ATCC MYA-4626 / FGSC 10389) TaxID=936046 RepID=UPI00029F7A23|nr:hypothetical protein AGABI2DRAFT_180503 [Agaricus bisporus var. bisporus H97]EKV44185.1 hypothetical protein AGABI2DRAFT_180503 [Agaricus bisporus var. bisporus H97]
MTDDLATPYSLRTKPGTTSATSSPGDAVEDVLDIEIERQIERAENLVSRLYKKRNEIRSPIYSLPPEILTLIFKFACPPLDFPQEYGLDWPVAAKVASPYILSVLTAVSARWHNLILSTPSLWTSFVADDRDPKVMETIFSRAGNHLVSTSLEFPIESLTYKYRVAILAPTLQEHASQIHMLHVCNASATWLKNHIRKFVNLEFLWLEDSEEREAKSISIKSSCTRLVLKNFLLRFSLSWSKIEVLHLDEMPVDVCLKLLQKCTRLIEYRVKHLLNPMFKEIQLPSTPFVLPRLKVFGWAMALTSDENHATLQHIRLPVLQTLIWDEGFYEYDVASLPHVSTFFEHLPPTLSAVEIQKGESPSGRSSVFSYFSNLSNIESLTLRECSSAFVNEVFSTLGSEICLEEMPVFPKLKSIHIDGVEGNLDQAKILQTFRRSCSQLAVLLSGSPLRIEITRHKMKWIPELKEELVRMVEKGYRVELWVNSKPVDWLPR